MTSRTRFTVVLAALGALALLVVTLRHSRADHADLSVLPASAQEDLRRPLDRDHHQRDAALARAVAALGRADDGDATLLAGLDTEARAHGEDARALLNAAPAKRINPKPQPMQAGGVVMQTGAATGSAPPTATAPPTSTAPAQHPTALHPPTIDGDGTTTTIHGREVWAAIPYDPRDRAGAALHIRNASGAAYVVSLHGADMSSVRLNGGLVVPGRSYLLDGTVTINAAVPVGVHVRPLAAVPAWWPEPIRMPTGAG